MNELENYTIDVLRGLEEWQNKATFLSVDTVINTWFRNSPAMKKYSRQIHGRIISNDWAFAIEENDGLKINENGLTYLESVTTDDYIIDRCFNELKQQPGSYTYIDNLFRDLKLQADMNRLIEFQELLKDSGLIDDRENGHYDEIKLNTKGIVTLKKFESYSAYKESLLKQENSREPLVTSVTQHFNVGGDIIGSHVNQDSFLEVKPKTQSVTTTPKIKDKTINWYTSPIFIYIIWPLLVVLIGGYILHRLGWV